MRLTCKYFLYYNPPSSIEKVNEEIKEAKPKIKVVLYVGWTRRIIDGRRKIIFIAATGDTASEARKNFKTSTNFGENVWIV